MATPHDQRHLFAAEAGQLQLNAFGSSLPTVQFKSVLHLTKGCVVLADRCVDGITANRTHCAPASSVPSASPPSTPTSAMPTPPDVAAEAHASGRGVAEIAGARADDRRGLG